MQIHLWHRLHEGSFTWVDGAPLSFNGWTTPPRKGSSNNCVQVTTDQGWEDALCDTQNAFICKVIRPGEYIFHIL